MPGLELRYPDVGGSVATFTTDRAPSLNGSSWPRRTGYGVQVAADQLTIYSYKFSAPWVEYVLPMQLLTKAERDLLDAFVDTTAGEAFFLRAGVDCEVQVDFVKVKLSVDELPWVPESGQRWAVTLRCRQSL